MNLSKQHLAKSYNHDWTMAIQSLGPPTFRSYHVSWLCASALVVALTISKTEIPKSDRADVLKKPRSTYFPMRNGPKQVENDRKVTQHGYFTLSSFEFR